MSIPNPLILLRWIWWPFGFVLKVVLVQLGKSDRFWNYWMECARSAGVPEELIAEYNVKRASMLSGATVVMPAKPFVVGSVSPTEGRCVCGFSGQLGSHELYQHLMSCPTQAVAVEKSPSEQVALLNKADK